MEQAFDDGNNHVQIRTSPVWLLIASRFYLIFAFQINLSPILLPLLCMGRGISFVFREELYLRFVIINSFTQVISG